VFSKSQSNLTAGYTLKGIDTSMSKKHELSPVHSNILHKHQNMWQCKCPSADEWTLKIWYTYTMEYYSALKREGNPVICDLDEQRGHCVRWISQMQRDKYHMVSLM
jgi:hypothetical protein